MAGAIDSKMDQWVKAQVVRHVEQQPSGRLPSRGMMIRRPLSIPIKRRLLHSRHEIDFRVFANCIVQNHPSYSGANRQATTSID